MRADRTATPASPAGAHGAKKNLARPRPRGAGCNDLTHALGANLLARSADFEANLRAVGFQSARDAPRFT
jgi:hypothetical protein